jgi:hypothetical protein
VKNIAKESGVGVDAIHKPQFWEDGTPKSTQNDFNWRKPRPPVVRQLTERQKLYNEIRSIVQ